MGLRVGLYRNSYNSKNNLLNNYNEVVLVNVEGPFGPTLDAPAAFLTRNALNSVIVKPDLAWFKANGLFDTLSENGSLAFGGAYAATSDSRFSEALRALNVGQNGYVAIPVHDYSLELEGS